MRNKKIWTTEKYDKLSNKYDSKMKFILPNKYRLKIFEYLNSGSVLDVACGTGIFLEYAYKKKFKCYGIDLSKGMIKQAKNKNPNINLMIASYYKIPFYFNFIHQFFIIPYENICIVLFDQIRVFGGILIMLAPGHPFTALLLS
jgi:ubiquinone/menaquinone biosynthesis C-methylase UbiE